MAKQYENDKKKVRRYLLGLSAVVLAASAIILCVGWGGDDNFKKDFLYEIITAILFATITVVAINLSDWLVFKDDIERSHDADIAKRIWNLLKAEKAEDNIIQELYDEEAAKTVMKNSIAYFNNKISSDFCRLVTKCSNVIRENFEYIVKVDKNSNKRFFIEQELRYIRNYIPSKEITIERPCMKCAFSFSTNELDAKLSDNSFFFREEISDTDIIDAIKELIARGKKEDIARLLNFKAFLFHKERPFLQTIDEIIIDNETIIFKIFIDDKFINIKENKMISYEGMVTCSYTTVPTSNFYCVFADTIIGKTKFSISFGRDIIRDIRKDVKFITYLTLPSEDEPGDKPDDPTRITYPSERKASFETFETIFPRSGFVVNWDSAYLTD
ncbi:MAG: hypothetical protein K2F97_05935 [Muribaculaceae bacterium]|nr:hypothetical protein [Muribaculaceae bacterium]